MILARGATMAKKVVRTRKTPAPQEVEVPDYFLEALRRHGKALAAFNAFPPSHKREYVDWIAEAGREETRVKRIATAVSRILEGR
jgi:uncharacterized protein YdeI (YjbR/CyaY-like superfamily)